MSVELLAVGRAHEPGVIAGRRAVDEDVLGGLGRLRARFVSRSHAWRRAVARGVQDVEAQAIGDGGDRVDIDVGQMMQFLTTVLMFSSAVFYSAQRFKAAWVYMRFVFKRVTL